jgi:aminopeptidase N
MKSEPPRLIYLKDYRPPAYLTDTVELDVKLHPTETRVMARLTMRPNPASDEQGAPLVLDGEKIRLESLTLNGVKLNDYELSPDGLTLPSVPDEPFVIEVSAICNPQDNKALMGLYRSRDLYCTQCEPQGFRRIMFHQDRPDVLARFRVRMEADKDETPELLANGNLVEYGVIPDTGRHFAIWEDPFPKPSYLFAMVAGKLAFVEDRHLTASGREVTLRIFVEPGNEDRCGWAMECLKRAMAWDERRFGLEYDLDMFMIVAVSDFNFGAMENKGLNIFNDKLVLARPDTATDGEYEAIESVIAHEYFHNWTGNRVTCQNWFQLCLKEGLTVFRDQEFSSDERSRTVQRIADVRFLKARQFAEDAGPLAHPVRPEYFIEINNFYTRTVYEKGAELCRMLFTMFGEDGFREGLDLYFERNDGQAATVEDFIGAMADANEADLDQFMRWYSQAGAPELTCKLFYSSAKKTAKLTVKQSTKPTPGQPEKLPFHIPLKLGLLGSDGKDMPLKLAGGEEVKDSLLHIREEEHTFDFEGVMERPTPSFLREFSAPVRLTTGLSNRELEFLMGHDRDLFNRWEAGQTLAAKFLMTMTDGVRQGKNSRPGAGFMKALAKTIVDESLDPAYRAAVLAAPSEIDIAQEIGANVDPSAVHAAREQFRRALGRGLKDELLRLYEIHAIDGPYSPDAGSVGRRALRNSAMSLLAASGIKGEIVRVVDHYHDATNMTDTIAALAVLSTLDGPAAGPAFADFYEKWKDDHVVIDKWFALKAQSPRMGDVEGVRGLMANPLFSLETPNKVRAVLGVFANGNALRFNEPDGRGYDLVAGAILEIDKFNPMTAARLTSAFESWRILEPKRQALARAAVERVVKVEGLSRDTFEIASKILKAADSPSLTV